MTFIVSQILHIPLVIDMGSFLQTVSLLVNAVILGLLARLFEETARYILFKFILKDIRSWNEGSLVGLGHGGTEALLLGIFAALAFINITIYCKIDLSTVPSIPADQLELARQRVAAYGSAPWYIALLGFVERIFAICLHVSPSVMVLYAIACHRPICFWLCCGLPSRMPWPCTLVSKSSCLSSKASSRFALLSLWIALRLPAG